MMQYVLEQLIRSVRLKNPVAGVQATGSTDEDLRVLINESIWENLIPGMMKLQEEFFTLRERLAIGSNNQVRIPHRALYQKIRFLYLVDSSGNRTRLPNVQKERLDDAVFNTQGYYIENNHIVIHPENTAGAELEVHYFFRPGEIVLSTECRQIISINYATKQVTFADDSPADWDADFLYDIHSGQSGAEIDMFDAAVTGIGPGASPVITFADALDGSLFGTRPVLVGDWVCLAETAALPGLPRELHPQVARAAALMIAETLKDSEAVKIHGAKLQGALGAAAGAMEQRVDGDPPRITGRGGILWASRRR